MTCKEANNILLSDVLSALNCKALKRHRETQETWYTNPIREERVSSFSVNTKLNLWYDFGIEKGGTVIDLIMLRHSLSVKDALAWLATKHKNLTPSFNQYYPSDKIIAPRLSFRKSKRLYSYPLKNYLESRNIDLQTAYKHVLEIHYLDTKTDKIHYAIGIKNNSQGYSLRNPYGKTVLGKVDFSYVQAQKTTNKVVVVEGIFDYLSYLMMFKTEEKNILILNSLTTAKKASSFLLEQKNITEIFLLLDTPNKKSERSISNMNNVVNYFKAITNRVYNGQKTYDNYSDLNDYWATEKDPKITYELLT